MLIGTLIGNIIIKKTAQGTPNYDDFGHLIEVPQENLFLYAAIMVIFLLFFIRQYRFVLKLVCEQAFIK